MGDSTTSSTTARRTRVTMLARLHGEGKNEAPSRFCHCGMVDPLCTSWMEQNPGRRFFGCKNYLQRGACGFFQWHDDEMGDRYRDMINELLGHVDRVYNGNMRLRRRRDEQGVAGCVQDDIVGIYANMKKNERRLRLAFCALLLTWVFIFVFTVLNDDGLMYPVGRIKIKFMPKIKCSTYYQSLASLSFIFLLIENDHPKLCSTLFFLSLAFFFFFVQCIYFSMVDVHMIITTSNYTHYLFPPF